MQLWSLNWEELNVNGHYGHNKENVGFGKSLERGVRIVGKGRKSTKYLFFRIFLAFFFKVVLK